MKATKAVWPERSCRDHVWGEFSAYLCELPDLHPGPCVSLSVRASIQRREAWETAEEQSSQEQDASEGVST